MEKGLIVFVVKHHYIEEMERRREKYTIFSKFYVLGLHFPYVISIHFVVDIFLFFRYFLSLCTMLPLKGVQWEHKRVSLQDTIDFAI